MQILYIEWKSFGSEDIKEAFEELGHIVIAFPYESRDVYHNIQLENKISASIYNENIDVVFSSNYYVPVSIACHELGVPYISWIYDSPFSMLYSYTTVFETNYIFTFDIDQYKEFVQNNIRTVHYMPLASNPDRLQMLVHDELKRRDFENSKLYNSHKIAFVGSLYDEEHTFYRRLNSITDYTRGYLEGVIAAQSKVYGYNFVRGLINEDIMKDMSNDLPLKPDEYSVVSKEYLYAEYVINREITARERCDYLQSIGKRFSAKGENCMDIYVPNDKASIYGAINHGPVEPVNIAPMVYNNTAININITLRSIHSGIPLRAFEVMGSGGFLLTNYQQGFNDCYIDGEDYVSYESREDMLDKIDYYLNHESERKEIAFNGLKKTKELHTYKHRIEDMLKLVSVPL